MKKTIVLSLDVKLLRKSLISNWLVIRIYLSRMLSQFYPNLYVLSFNEITSEVQIQALGNITMQKKETVDKT